MRESSVAKSEPSRGNIGTAVLPRTERRRFGTIVPVLRAVPIHFGKSKVGIIAQALWPDGATAGLAKVLRCTKRHAGLVIDGKRKLNARGAHALLGEIIS